MRQCVLLLIGIITVCTGRAQVDSTYQGISTVVFLDSFVVTAQRKGFQVDDFIKLVQEDDSFYEAFRNFRFVSADFTNELTFYDKRKKVRATYQSTTRQESDGLCRTMKFLNRKRTGNYFKKNKKLRYYTARLYNRIFYTRGRKCGDPFADGFSHDAKGLDKHINELKKLIFRPGQAVDIPIVGKKTEVFSEALMPYYDYAIRSKRYQDDRDCYVFTVSVKPQYESQKTDKTIIKFLETYFDKETFQVVARRYKLQYFGLAFDFDVTMDIELQQVVVDGSRKYLPLQISYDGWWDIPARQPEIAQFKLKLLDIR